MPGFGTNTRVVAGQALQANAIGSVRQPLTPFARRTGDGGTADVNDFRNNGAPIGIPSTVTNAVPIHIADLSALDEVYLWASNKGTTNTELTISFVTGGFMINDQPVPDNTITAAMTSDQRIVTVVGPKTGLQLVYPGIPHTNNDAIFAVSSNAEVNICGFVMRRFRENAADVTQGFDGKE